MVYNSFQFQRFFVNNSSTIQQEIVSSLLSLSLQKNEVKNTNDSKAITYTHCQDTRILANGKLNKVEALCSDSRRSYGAFAKSNTSTHKKHDGSKSQRSVNKVYHVQKVNNMNMRLRKLMDSFKGVDTKYLQNYLNWFLVLE